MSTERGRIRQAILALMLAAATAAQPAAAESALRPWPDKQPAPALALNDLDGQQWDIGRLRGKVIVLNFWASWCAPCVDEIPLLNDLAGDAVLADKLVILGINYKESVAAIRRFADAHPLRYPILRDVSGEAFRKWTAGVLPTTVLIGPDGRVRWRAMGELERSDGSLRQALDNMLQERGQAHAARDRQR